MNATIYLKIELTGSKWKATAFRKPCHFHTMNKNIVMTRGDLTYIVCVLSDHAPKMYELKSVMSQYHERYKAKF